MSNNRLYIGNKKTKEYVLLAKGWGVGWDGGVFDEDKLNDFLAEQTGEGYLGCEFTDLVLFTEYSPEFDEFHKANNAAK